MMRNKKGVSPVIADVLMIVVAGAISLVVYVWASGFVSEKTGAETKAVDNTNIRNTGNDITFGDGSAGTVDVSGFLAQFDVYKNNALQDSTSLGSTSFTLQNSSTDRIWDKGEVLTIDFDSSAFSAGDKIKLVHKESGTPIVFTLE